MPVTVEQVRLHIEAGLTELGAIVPAPDAPVLLWAQQHPDGPDWAVPDSEFLRWAAGQPAPEALPSLSLTINPGQKTIEISARHSGRQEVHAQVSHATGGRRQTTDARVGVATFSARKETFRINAYGTDRSDVVMQAARRYVQMAQDLFVLYQQPPAPRRSLQA